MQLYQGIAARSSSYFIIADSDPVYWWIPDVYTGLGLAVGRKITGVLYMCSIKVARHCLAIGRQFTGELFTGSIESARH